MYVKYPELKMLKNISGIYKFENKINHKVYIGRSSNIYSRICEHFRHSKTPSSSCYNDYFHKALRKYSYDNWIISCIYKTNDYKELVEKELYFIHRYDSVDNGYNSTYSTDTPPAFKGEKHGNTLLTDNDVYNIRESYLNIEYPKDVYEKYKDKISLATFMNIWVGTTWKHIHFDVFTKENKKKHFDNGIKHRVLCSPVFSKTRDCVIEIRKLYAEEKLSQSEIYKEFSFLNKNTFFDIWYGRTFLDLMPEKYLEVKQRGRKYIRR